MAAGDFGGRVIRMMSGVLHEIDPKSTMKYMKKNHDDLMKTKAYSFGNNTAKFLKGGIGDSFEAMGEINAATGKKNGLFKGIAQGHSSLITEGADAGKYALDGKKVLGTAVSITAGGRILSGGGLYKDKNGNTNIPVVPFI